jgi:hypothetical protein
MPSPFPGMDPWLENPTDWTGFHDILIVATVKAMQPGLRARGYYAKPGERVWLTQPRRPIYPDVALISVPTSRNPTSTGAVLAPDEPIRMRRADVEVTESYVDIYDLHGNRLVTSIEYLSPANKSDTDGRAMYLRKQEEARSAGIHLVEIDLIRRGPHVLDIPEANLQDLDRWDYLINLVRRGTNEYEFYPLRLRNHLPVIRIPLANGDDDAALDLQAIFNESYEIGPYPDSLNYADEPQHRLADDDATWANEILVRAGYRT